jgi:hypothetical protein
MNSQSCSTFTVAWLVLGHPGVLQSENKGARRKFHNNIKNYNSYIIINFT